MRRYGVLLLFFIACSMAFSLEAYAKKCSMIEYRMYKKDKGVQKEITAARREAATDLYFQLMNPARDYILLYYHDASDYDNLMKNLQATEVIFFYYSPFAYVNVSSEKNRGYISINTASARTQDSANRYLQMKIPKIIKKLGITKKTEELTAAKRIHDYIKKTYHYDKTKKNKTSYKMVRDGKGICTAYAELYQYLCNYCGLRCEIIHGNRRTHAWNRVRCNAAWYYADVTWDDSEHTSRYRLKRKKAFYSDKKHYQPVVDKYVRVILLD